MPTKKIAQVPVELIAVKFDSNKKAIKQLEDENKELRKPLEDYLTQNGVVPNEETGHRICVLEHADAEITLKYTHKVSAILQPNAVEFLKVNGFDEAVETIEVVREDVIERLHLEGKLSDKQLKELYATKESDAFSVSVKNKFKGL